MSRSSIAGIAVILLASLAGLVDAARGSVWDLFVLFAAILTAECILLVRTITDRSSMTVRPDLALWLKQRAHTNGEPIEDVVDRALAFYQRGLYQPALDQQAVTEHALDQSVPSDGDH